MSFSSSSHFSSIKKYDLNFMRRVFRQRWTMVMNACYCYSSSYALTCGALEIGPLDERAAEYSRRFGKHVHILRPFSEVQLSSDQRAAVQLLDCIQIATDIATSCWAADEAGFSIKIFSIFGLALRLYEHAARGVPASSSAYRAS